MNDIEFAQHLLILLTDREFQGCLKRAALKGFFVPGYKNAWKATKMQVSGSIKNRGKEGDKNASLLIEAIKDLKEESHNTDKITAKQLAGRWIAKKNDDEQQKIIEDLKKMEEIITVQLENRKSEEGERLIHIDAKEIEKLTKQIKELQNLNRQQQLLIRSNKIQINNMQCENERTKKNSEKLIKTIAEKESIIHNLKEKLQDSICTIEIKEDTIHDLKKEIQVLQQFKDRAPKILCFCKEDTRNIELSGFNITYAKELDEELCRRIDNHEYDIIWIIVKKYSFNEICDIKHLAGDIVKEFYSISKLKEVVGGENGLKR